MSQNQIIGSRLKMYREKFGLSQALFAEYLKISREEVSYYENGRRPVPSHILSSAANLFFIDEYDFYETDIASSDVKLSLAFRADTVSAGDMKQIAEFKKVALNYIKMKTPWKMNIHVLEKKPS